MLKHFREHGEGQLIGRQLFQGLKSLGSHGGAQMGYSKAGEELRKNKGFFGTDLEGGHGALHVHMSIE